MVSFPDLLRKLETALTAIADNMFVLDFIPEDYLQGGAKNSVMIFTAGWAMKFVPLLGRALKDMALNGESDYRLKEFSILRTGVKDGRLRSIIERLDEDGFASADIQETEQARGSSVHYKNVEKQSTREDEEDEVDEVDV